MANQFSVGDTVRIKKPSVSSVSSNSLVWWPTYDIYDNTVHTVVLVDTYDDTFQVKIGRSGIWFQSDWAVLEPTSFSSWMTSVQPMTSPAAIVDFTVSDKETLDEKTAKDIMFGDLTKPCVACGGYGKHRLGCPPNSSLRNGNF